MDRSHVDRVQRARLHGTLVILASELDQSRQCAALMGLRLPRNGRGQEALLPDLPVLQARSLPPLLCLQQVHTQHGPPLFVDQQLHWLLE